MSPQLVSRGRWPGVLLAGFFLSGPGPAPLPAATPVAAGGNLTAALDGATATDHSFDLSGDVYLGAAFDMNSGNRKTVVIDGARRDGGGARAVITRRGAGSRFNVNTTGNTLAIRNAVISGGTSPGKGAGVIHVTAGKAALVLDNTLFTKNTATGRKGGAISNNPGASTEVRGNVAFVANTGSDEAAGAVGIYGLGPANRSTLTFRGETTFEQNSTAYYGGAVAIYEYGVAVFEGKATFRGNHVTTASGGAYFGGAIDLWGGNSRATFRKDVMFTGNYVRNTVTHIPGVRGGAINVGYVIGAGAPQLDFQGTATFTDNYVWGAGATTGVGGAISFAVSGGNPLDQGNIGASHVYGGNIARGIFTGNIAHSDTGPGYGGAIYAKAQGGTLTLGSGSRFTGNHAKTLGGAICFDQGTLNLDGNILFEGNRHGVGFDTTGGKPEHIAGTGTPNAIHFGASSNSPPATAPATLNLNTAAGERIDFRDPITATAGNTVTVNKTGGGEAVFYEHDSALLTKTTVSGGTFRLADGASYGRKGTPANSTFTIGASAPGTPDATDATLRGGAGSTLRATLLAVNGTLRADAGAFHIDTDNPVTFGAGAVLSVVIADAGTFSQIVFDTPASLLLNGATLKISASGYVPSLDMSDTFTLITGLSEEATGQFTQGESVMINGAGYGIVYNHDSIVLQQLTTVVPELAAYAALAGSGLLAFALLRRRRSWPL
ncbi:MAG: cell wall anchor protein [Opitutaceae bacterium]|nr:cell wall anchor protein [Opitutaceae bacterium]